MLVWIDIETTGLDPKRDVPLEVGLMVTDDGAEHSIAEATWLLNNKLIERRREEVRCCVPESPDAFVRDMHRASGLWSAFDKPRIQTYTPSEAAASMIPWLGANKAIGLPMTGSSVGFDRSWMKDWLPEFEAVFHYRNIDVSTLKTLCTMHNPRIAALMPEHTNPSKTHRPIPDIVDSREEYRFYLDNFLWTESQA